jgi:hypothetical protein
VNSLLNLIFEKINLVPIEAQLFNGFELKQKIKQRKNKK